jgi:hypothetical protein
MKNKLTNFSMVLLTLLASAAAHADMCDQPPFGTTEQEWRQAQAELEEIASALQTKLSPPGMFGRRKSTDSYLKEVVYKGLWKACHARYSAATLEDPEFEQAHIDLQQQKTLSPAILAVRFFHAQGYPFNPTTNVYCEMNGADGHPMWATGPECASAVTLRWQRTQQALRERQAQIQLEEQRQHPGLTYVYALFLCMRVTGNCRMAGPPRTQLGEFTPGDYFQTLAECKQRAETMTPYRDHGDGHYLVGDGMWYECRRHETDAWEPAN